MTIFRSIFMGAMYWRYLRDLRGIYKRYLRDIRGIYKRYLRDIRSMRDRREIYQKYKREMSKREEECQRDLGDIMEEYQRKLGDMFERGIYGIDMWNSFEEDFSKAWVRFVGDVGERTEEMYVRFQREIEEISEI